MGETRDHIIEILYINLRRIKDLLLPFLSIYIMTVGSGSSTVLPAKIIVGFIAFGVVSHSFFSWRNKTFEFYPTFIRYQEGVFRRYQQDILYERVKSSNTSSAVLKRFFGLSNFNVELVGGENISFVLKNNEIKKIEQTIYKNGVVRLQENDSWNKVRFSFKEYWLIPTANFGLITTAFTIAVTALSVSSEWFGDSSDETGIIDSFKAVDASVETFLVSGVVALGALLVAMFPIMLIVGYIVYCNFSICSTEKELLINYGTVNKLSYTLLHKDIRSLRINEPFFYRIFGYAQIKVDSIGLNDSSKHHLHIMPIIKKKDISSFLEKNLPQFEVVSNGICRPDKEVLPFYIGFNSLIFLSIEGMLIYFYTEAYYGLILMPLIIYIGYCKWRFSSLYFDDRFIQITYSSLIKKVTLVTHKKYVESAERGVCL